MIITDKFVLLAFPKTGTSYTTAALRNIHARRGLLGRMIPQKYQKRDFPRVNYREHRILQPPSPPHHKARNSRHGTYSDIPEKERHKKIVSTVRNPFYQYTSSYLFQTRMRQNLRRPAELDVLLARYPDYPKLNFADYYDMLHRFGVREQLQGVEPPVDLGLQTVNFINFYFKNPRDVLKKIDAAYIESKAYEEDMADIFFLHQEALAEEFTDFLRSMDYSDSECRQAVSLKQKNVSRRNREEESLSHFYDDQLLSQVLERDALIFKIFPEYAVGVE